MNYRQSGGDIYGALQGWTTMNTVVLQMIVDAYNLPLYTDPSIIAEVVQDFRAWQESKCFDVFSDPA